MSDSIYDVVHRYGLDRAQAAQLWDSATEQPPAQWPQQLWRILAWVSALLLGAGLIFWVAAQWPQQTRLFKLYLLQAAVAAADPADRIVVFGSFYTVGGVLINGTPRLHAKHLGA